MRSGLARAVAAVVGLRLALRAIPAVLAALRLRALRPGTSRLLASRLLAARFLATARLAHHPAEVLVHRAQQEEQRHAHRGHHEEPEDPGYHLTGCRGRGGGQDGQRLTISRMPANRSSSGSSVSTSDLARW